MVQLWGNALVMSHPGRMRVGFPPKDWNCSQPAVLRRGQQWGRKSELWDLSQPEQVSQEGHLMRPSGAPRSTWAARNDTLPPGGDGAYASASTLCSPFPFIVPELPKIS